MCTVTNKHKWVIVLAETSMAGIWSYVGEKMTSCQHKIDISGRSPSCSIGRVTLAQHRFVHWSDVSDIGLILCQQRNQGYQHLSGNFSQAIAWFTHSLNSSGMTKHWKSVFHASVLPMGVFLLASAFNPCPSYFSQPTSVSVTYLLNSRTTLAKMLTANINRFIWETVRSCTLCVPL